MSSAAVAPFEPQPLRSAAEADEKKTRSPEFQTFQRPRFGLCQASWVTIVFFIVVSAGALVSHYCDDDGVDRVDFDSYEWPVQIFAFVVPSVVVFIVTLLLLERGATSLGMDVCEEAADSGGVKNACIATWTNVSVVSALVLGMTLGDIVLEPLDPPYALISQWAVFFSHISCGWNLITILISFALIMYTSHLEGADMENFCRHFPTCAAIPTVYMYGGLVYISAAVILQVYHKSGLYTGSVIGILTPTAFVYPTEYWNVVSQWKRPGRCKKTPLIS